MTDLLSLHKMGEGVKVNMHYHFANPLPITYFLSGKYDNFYGV